MKARFQHCYGELKNQIYMGALLPQIMYSSIISCPPASLLESLTFLRSLHYISIIPLSSHLNWVMLMNPSLPLIPQGMRTLPTVKVNNILNELPGLSYLGKIIHIFVESGYVHFIPLHLGIFSAGLGTNREHIALT